MSLKSIFNLITGQLTSQKTANHDKKIFDIQYFNCSISCDENSDENKFLTISLLVKGIAFQLLLLCWLKLFPLFAYIFIDRTKNYVQFNTCYWRSNLRF